MTSTRLYQAGKVMPVWSRTTGTSTITPGGPPTSSRRFWGYLFSLGPIVAMYWYLKHRRWL